MCDKTLHVISKAIYAYIYNSIINKGIKLIPRDEICSDLGIATITFSKYFKPLMERSIVKVIQTYMDGRFYHNTYTIDDTPPSQCHKPIKQDDKHQKIKRSAKSSKVTQNFSDEFEELWELYPRKQGKKPAFEKFNRVIKSGSATVEQIREGIIKYAKYAKEKDPKFVLMGSTFFNQERWNDNFDTLAEDNSYRAVYERLMKKNEPIEVNYKQIEL